MNNKDQDRNFVSPDMDKYSEEAKKRWGDTEAYKQSQQRVKKMTKEDFARIQVESDLLMNEMVVNMKSGVGSEQVQKLIDRHYNNLRHFYEPNLELYRGLAGMYVEDVRFSEYFEKFGVGLAGFMSEAMVVYCDRKSDGSFLYPVEN